MPYASPSPQDQFCLYQTYPVCPFILPRGATMSPFVKPTDQELRGRLTREQYEVTQHEGTEPPFRNEYWNNHRAGLYVDVVTGQPLFSSADKFESGTGWPSFTRPIDPKAITTKSDGTLGMERTE